MNVEFPFNLVIHYSICHEDKISKCVCGDTTLSGTCVKEIASPMKTDCSVYINVNDNNNDKDNVTVKVNVNDNANQ